MSAGPRDAGSFPARDGGYWIKFDGDKLDVFSPDGSLYISVPAVSGKPGTTAADQFKEDVGPLPEGSYEVRGSDFQEGPPGGFFWQGFADWGDYYAPIDATSGTDTQGRSGFHIHGGVSRGSAGCIDVGPHDRDLYQALKDLPGTIPIIVQYDNPNAFNWEESDAKPAWDPPAGPKNWPDAQLPINQDDAPPNDPDDGGGPTFGPPAPAPGVKSDADQDDSCQIDEADADQDDSCQIDEADADQNDSCQIDEADADQNDSCQIDEAEAGVAGEAVGVGAEEIDGE